MRPVAILFACVLGCMAVGGTSALLSPQGEWYATLTKPRWTPPGYVFGIVWPILYAMMGIALFLVLQKGWTSGGVKWAAMLFAIQLALNFCWSPVFFRFHALGLSVAIIIAMWLMIGWTTAAFWSVRDWAGALLLPYWAWVTFATALNTAIWRMN